jgi:hypothetical protein
MTETEKSIMKYDYNSLYEYCKKNKIELLGDYSKIKNREEKIKASCSSVDCINVVEKTFRLLLQCGCYCKSCMKIVRKEKVKKTCLEKYGVEYIIHNEESKEKMINTNIQKYGFSCCLKNKDIQSKIKSTINEKYGTENPSQSNLVKQKLKESNLEKYGVCYPLQNKEIMEKYQETNIQKYGFKNCSMNVEVKNKRKNTMLQRYGVEYSSQNKEIKNKIIDTYNKKYGVNNPMQNQEIAEKSFNKSFLKKKYIFPSGKEISCQGYEPFALNELVNIFDENDILTGTKNVPTIWYNDENGKKHRHYVDIFIPSKNKCIEIKSPWTIKIIKSNIFIKQTAAKELGYEYEIWVYDCKGNKVDTYL